MRLVEYTPADFDDLLRAVGRMTSALSLRHRPFVDHYYTAWPGCRLYLARDDSGEIIGMLGIDRMPFRYGERDLVIGAGSNFEALQKGVGGLLYFQWLKSCPLALVFGGSTDTHHIIAARKWTYYGGFAPST